MGQPMSRHFVKRETLQASASPKRAPPIELATQMAALTIEADATQIAADAAAIEMIASFGMGMAAYVSLEAAAVVEKAVVSMQAKDFNHKLNQVSECLPGRTLAQTPWHTALIVLSSLSDAM
ncbi:hypothetical protein PSPO01_16565 [Paraphaeosphaeria sporulosa]